MNCEQVREQISAMLDGELSENDRAFVMEHLAACPECRRVYEAFSAISDSLHDLDDVPDGFTESVMCRIRSEANTPKRGHRLPGILAMAACLALVLFAGRNFLSAAKSDNGAAISNYDTNISVTDTADSPSADTADDAAPEAEEKQFVQARLMSYDNAIVYQNCVLSSEPSSAQASGVSEESASEADKNDSALLTNEQPEDTNGTANFVNAAALDEVLSVADTAVYGSFDLVSDYTVLFLDTNGDSASLDVWVDGDRLYYEDDATGTAYYAAGTHEQLLALLEN